MPELIVTGEVPVETSVKDCFIAVFSGMLPKLRLAELIVNCGLACGLDAVVPVPLRTTRVVPPVVELLLIVSCPTTEPAAAGSNCS